MSNGIQIEQPLSSARSDVTIAQPDPSMTSLTAPTRLNMNGTVPAQNPANITSQIANYTSLFGKMQPAATSAAAPIVPTSQDKGGITDDATSLLNQLLQPMDPALARAAATPVAVGRQIATPAALTTPIKPFQPQPFMPSSYSQGVVGRHAARQRGIANAITGVSNAVGEITTMEAQKKQQNLNVNFGRLASAQQQIDQARQVLQNDPNNADAKRVLDENTATREEILKDKGLRNVIQKGLKVSFTDPQANKDPNVQQMQRATQSYGEQFEKAMPRQLGPNVMAQQQLATAQAQQKFRLDVGKEIKDIVKAKIDAGGKVDAATVKGLMDITAKKYVANKVYDAAMERNKTMMDISDYDNRTKLAVANIEAAARENKTDDLMTYYDKMQDDYTTKMSEVQGKRADIQRQINDVLKTSKDQGLIQELRTRDASLQQLEQGMRIKHDTDIAFIKTRWNLPDTMFKEPTIPKVGEGGLSAGPSSKQQPSASTGEVTRDVNPITGQQFSPGTPTIDKLLIRGGSTAQGIAQEYAGSENPVSRFAREFDPVTILTGLLSESGESEPKEGGKD